MKRRIFKYELPAATCVVDAYDGPVLAVGVQDANIVVWVLANVDAMRKRTFRCFNTGNAVGDADYEYVGTVTVLPYAHANDGIVWHVFELRRVEFNEGSTDD